MLHKRRASGSVIIPDGYRGFISGLKARIRSAQAKAIASANREMIVLYWEIGRQILLRQKNEGWGSKVIDTIARDLSAEFSGMKGWSPRNLLFMRMFAERYPALPIVKQLVSLLPWGHVVRLLQMVKDDQERAWYIRRAATEGWSRESLVDQVAKRLFHRQGRVQTNFSRTLPAPHAGLAQHAFKDPYVFDFLTVGPAAVERDVERQLIVHMRRFLQELGAGFAFVGQQVHLEVDETDYVVDLLFYHVKLHCYVVVEMKAVEFRPEHAGQLNFYLSAVDEKLRSTEDKPTIGLLLCRGRKKLTVEYALRNVSSPIGVAQWQDRLTSSLPKALKGSLPSVAAIERELSGLKEKRKR
ncbi:MAG: DUF1016 family protein [Candidatus Omnitrophica bacterium]|nr:DUF1016 family protein [Candidatus Omnitrophota bacterium]